MAKMIGLGALYWACGVGLCAILLNLLFKIHTESPTAIYMWSFGGIFAIGGFLFTMVWQIKKIEIDRLNKMINLKAEQNEFSIFKKYIECQMSFFEETVKQNAGIMEEARTNVELMVQNNTDHNNEILSIIKKLVKEKNVG
jgi:hypothetical protein